MIYKEMLCNVKRRISQNPLVYTFKFRPVDSHLHPSNITRTHYRRGKKKNRTAGANSILNKHIVNEYDQRNKANRRVFLNN